MVGIYPSEAKTYTNEVEYKIIELAKNPKVVAIGEIGLDYYWNKENKELQKEVFMKQIELANKLDLPIVIHTRDAAIDTIEILKKYKYSENINDNPKNKLKKQETYFEKLRESYLRSCLVVDGQNEIQKLMEEFQKQILLIN